MELKQINLNYKTYHMLHSIGILKYENNKLA
jgi:hypothetical protein